MIFLWSFPNLTIPSKTFSWMFLCQKYFKTLYTIYWPHTGTYQPSASPCCLGLYFQIALGGTKNDSYNVIKFSRAIGAWYNDALCVKDIGTVYDLTHAYYVEKWKNEINMESGHNVRNKLRTYKMLKQDFGPSEYVNNIFINKHQHSAFTKFRCGVASSH